MHIYVSVPSQDLDFQHHMACYFSCSMSWGEERLTVLLIMVEVLTITVKISFHSWQQQSRVKRVCKGHPMVPGNVAFMSSCPSYTYLKMKCANKYTFIIYIETIMLDYWMINVMVWENDFKIAIIMYIGTYSQIQCSK